ncbi:type II toxin-antitoxin system Phd/YefM family antitoxin [Candidatus Gottesmanbacteria bacterium]|nr:type II toxin-antitoxin system Phd/YefM family antitoxin [Candidatus Gottesmanbacteria bacterium]
MSYTQVTIDDLRTNLADIMGRVMYGNNRVVIRKYNRQAAVLISIEDYKKFTDPTKRYSPKEWQNKFAVFEDIKNENAGKNARQIEKNIAKAVKDVRAQKK